MKAEPSKLVIEGMSTAELEQMLKERKKAEREEKKERRAAYEQERDALVEELSDFAMALHGQMLDLKYEAMKKLTKFREVMLEYGSLRRGEHNKGSFEIKTDKYKIKFTSQINKRFDERADLAETKLKEFLLKTVKKRDQESYRMIMALLERTKGGDFDIDLINRLYTMEDAFDDPLWKEALSLFKESYSPIGTAVYVQFSRKVESNNSWENIVLDFAKIKADSNEAEG